MHYDTLVARYREKWKTTKLVMRNYWWPEVMRDVGQYIEGYDMCQRIKNRTEIPVGELRLSKIPNFISISLYSLLSKQPFRCFYYFLLVS